MILAQGFGRSQRKAQPDPQATRTGPGSQLQVAAVLTPEQRQSIRTQMDERRAKWQARHAEKSA